MFDITSIPYNSEHPAFMAILFTVVSALILGTCIAFTYEKTSREVGRPDHFLQALVLITIVAATILQAIGDSVARGLGMLGALSIIRFRTTIRDPRNIVFMFASIAAGIACGVFGITIAATGTLAFCATAFLLRFSSFSQERSLIGHLKIQVPRDYEDFPELERLLKKYCKRFVLDNYKVFPGEKKANILQYNYRLKLKDTSSGAHLIVELKEFPEVKVQTLVFQNEMNAAI